MNLISTAAYLTVLLYCTTLPNQSEAKIFTRQGLWDYLHDKTNVDLPTWVCIAYHESKFNTAATSPVNKNKSRDHGIFQINDKYWCTASGPAGHDCHAKCSSFEDDDISDDFACAQTIYKRTKRSKGDGFKAWSTYKFCNTAEKIRPFNCEVSNCNA